MFSPLTQPAPGLISVLEKETRPTLTVPEAGSLLGLNRQQSYLAAQSGHLPTVQISERRKVVPIAALKRMLAMEPSPAPDAVTESADHAA